jgi:rhamnopyranosyl-N-acetylglucosaminyl-diphospho-decaprenol beta-1,3/1,4-galactofuranosyltransferase
VISTGPVAIEDRRSPARVCAVVVTFERRELLRRCLLALSAERRPPDGVLVVDNASSDGTPEMVRGDFPDVELLRLPANVGGAGGFCRGMARAHAAGYDWLWLMDDDTFVNGETLATLLAGAARAPGGLPLVVCSQVRWKDERLHPMNVPMPRWRSPAAMAAGAAEGLLALRHTTFVSVAVHRDAVDRFGLPLERYFIWSDDVEFTARVLRDAPGYLVPDSVAYHWTATPHPPAAVTSDRFYYHARNSLLLLRGSALGPLERVDHARYYLRTLVEYVRANARSPRRWLLLLRAITDGLRGPVR